MAGGDIAVVRPAFRALAEAIVPRAADLDEAGWSALEAIVQDALRQRRAALRRQLVLFIRVANALPILRFGRTFRRLDPERRIRFLRSLERSRLFLIRRGFWGLRTLVFMGYYGRPEARESIGYGARLRGWLEHPAATEAARRRTLEGLDREAAAKAHPAAPEGGGAVTGDMHGGQPGGGR